MLNIILRFCTVLIHHAAQPARVIILFGLVAAILDPHLLLLALCGLLLVLLFKVFLLLDALVVLLLVVRNHIAEQGGVLMVTEQV